MAHGLLSGADGGRLFVRTVAAVLVIHRNVAGNVLALLTSRLKKTIERLDRRRGDGRRTSDPPTRAFLALEASA
jgi:hypothetical protein